MGNKLWSYSPGVKSVNRIRVYERRPGGAIYVEWYDRLGRHQRTLTTVAGVAVTDKKLAQKIADAMAAAQAKRRHKQTARTLLGLPEPHTLRELLEEYHRANPEWSAGHQKNQSANRAFWLRHLGPETQLTDITPAIALEAIHAEQRANVDGFGPRTQQRRIVYIRTAFQFAVEQLKWLTPAEDLKGLKVPKVRGQSKPYSMEEVRALLPATEEVDLRCAVVAHVAWASGRRATAIQKLPADAYRVEAHGDEVYGVLSFPGHTDKARRAGEVYLFGRAKELVEQLLATRAVQTSGQLFPSGDLHTEAPKGETITDQSLRNWLHQAEEQAGVEHIKGRAYHGFKRRFATAALREDPQAASKQSGTNVETLRQHYEQDDAGPKAELARRMDALLHGGA